MLKICILIYKEPGSITTEMSRQMTKHQTRNWAGMAEVSSGSWQHRGSQSWVPDAQHKSVLGPSGRQQESVLGPGGPWWESVLGPGHPWCSSERELWALNAHSERELWALTAHSAAAGGSCGKGAMLPLD